MHRLPRRSITVNSLLIASMIGCSDGDGGLADPQEPPDDTPAGIGVVSGISQSGIVGSQLAEPLVAKVVSRMGAPLPGVTVNWVVEAGEGSFASPVSVTDQDGLAETRYTLGDTPGENSMLAAVAGTSLSARFLAMALPAQASRAVRGGRVPSP
jgi:hypothetical protein